MKGYAVALGLGAAVGAVGGLLFAWGFNGLSRLVAAGLRLWERWRTWQGASREQREQMRREDDRFDLWDNDLREQQ